MTSVRVALVPGVLALLPEYAGLADPVSELRAACLDAVAWLGADVRVLADAQGERVATYLLAECDRGFEARFARTSTIVGGVLVVGNGSASRSEKAPGHLNVRSFSFDEALGAALRAGRLDVDLSLADDLLAAVDGIRGLVDVLDGSPAIVDYDDDPFGVQYWVMRWECQAI